MKNEVVKNLEVVLANSYALTVKTQNYHWNVVGENFTSLHAMFETQYNELFAALDEIAERIRALGNNVTASFEHFSKTSQFKNGDEKASAKTMLKDLTDDHESVARFIAAGIKTAQANGDEGTADMLIGRLKAHEKMIWMLEASQK